MRRYANQLYLALVFFSTCFSARAADPEFKAGGVALTLPGPGSDFVESGDKLRTTFFELLAPASNRLLSAYLSAQTMADFGAGKTAPKLDVYALVEVPRKAEYADCTPNAFEQVVKGFEPAMGKLGSKDYGEIEQEMNLRLKTLGTKPIAVDQPQMLGGIFQKTDAAGYAMLTAYKAGDRSVTMAGGFALLRVRQRLLFAYLFAKYDSPDTVTWIRKNLESWSDAILAKNN